MAFSDVHSPRFLADFARSMRGQSCTGVDLVVMAGDLIDKGKLSGLDPVLRIVRRECGDSVLVGVFGNEEYHQLRDKLRSLYPMIRWLEDEVLYGEADGCRYAVVGTPGALDRPTSWQARNLPGIEAVYRERPQTVARLIREARSRASVVMLVSHYGLTRLTLEGEPRRIWPYLYSSLMERVIVEEKPDLAIHGHAHKGKRMAVVDGVPVYNVAFPVWRRPVVIDLKCAGK
ncbi:MAG: metallophosphoesterase [Desulfurococcales archaeon]|nr:metallophosphoesterase [Desulfurococcales archaeon]